MNLNLIPSVRKMLSAAGGCDLGKPGVLNYAGLNRESLALLKKRFPKWKAVKAKSGCFLELSTDGKPVKGADPENGLDAYALTVSNNGVRINAAEEKALFCGMQTLLQLPDSVDGMVIQDSASVKMRMVHWDLKGYQPTLKTMKEELKILASVKINSILLELEDKYAYRCAPEVGVPGAYTLEDMREISRYAAALHITIVPKLQCLAHVDYLLKHKKFRSLREDGHSFQYCATNPKAQKLWEQMADELMECFAEHPVYFHIGADETDLLGVCPECAKLGKAGSYIHKVRQAVDFLIQRGRKPVMWEDILRNLHHNIPEEEVKKTWELGRKAVLMYWAYGYGAKNNTFPFLHEYLSNGMEVWGASGFSGCDNWAGSLPPFAVRAQNLDAWAKSAVENQLPCVVATGWTKIGSADCPAEPQESSWFTILYSAETTWSGKHTEYETFLRKCSLFLYGKIVEEELLKSVMDISKNQYVYDMIPKEDRTDRRLVFLRYAAAAESLIRERNRITNYLQYYDGRLGVQLQDYRVTMMKRYAEWLIDKLKTFRSELRPLLLEFYTEYTADDFIQTRFGYLEKLTADFKRQLDQTKMP